MSKLKFLVFRIDYNFKTYTAASSFGETEMCSILVVKYMQLVMSDINRTRIECNVCQRV